VLLRIDSSVHESGSLLTVSGEIDLDTVDLLRDSVSEILDEQSCDLVIDLDDVGYIDSAGLGVLVGTYNRLAESQRSLCIRCSSPRILRLFEITGLTELLHIDRTTREARAMNDGHSRSVSV
jgi:anti-sigma B factor antagonist